MDKIKQIKITLSKHPELSGLLERLEVLESEMIQLDMDLVYVDGGGAELDEEVGEEGMKAVAELRGMISDSCKSLFGQGWI